jgi:hypothetical protein
MASSPAGGERRRPIAVGRSVDTAGSLDHTRPIERHVRCVEGGRLTDLCLERVHHPPG